MFQKCPICNGQGTLPNTATTACLRTCEVCNGTALIDEMTGLPPARMSNLEESNKLFDNAINNIRKLAGENKTKAKEPIVYGKDSVNNLKWVEPSIEGDAKITLK